MMPVKRENKLSRAERLAVSLREISAGEYPFLNRRAVFLAAADMLDSLVEDLRVVSKA